MSEMTIPNSWVSTTLETICLKITDGSHNPPKPCSEGKPMISAKNIVGGKILFGEGYRLISEDGFELEAKRTRIKPNDILLTIVGALGRSAIVPSNIQEFTLQRSVAVLSSRYCDTKFIKYSLDAPTIQHYIVKNAKGTAQKGIYLNQLKQLPLSIPSISEQQEIVRQLDVMLAQVEQIKARLDAIPAILKKFRQSVLADAVSGKSMGDSNYKDWIQSTIGKEFKCIDGDRGKNYPKKEDYKNEGYCLFLSTKNVRKFGFLFDEKVFISKEKHGQLRNGTLQRDDLIITTRGTLGHIASYNETVPFDVIRINSGMLILRKINDRLLNEFVMLYLASPIFQRIIEEQRTGSAQPQLPAKILKDFEIRVPTIEQQYQIVERVNRQFSLIKWVENAVQSAQKRVNLLTHSILAKAFSGELTAEWREQHQDLITGVNSAEALLAKIQSEREVSKPVKNTRKKKEV